ncbi:MAG: hypothetical protein JSV79_13640 [Armatimonadota bacterium]|nr:MAG: hypothetical protein JSV79_13640 [Armatimonadota bacterium]
MTRMALAGLIVLIGLMVAASQSILRQGMRQFPEPHPAISWRTLQFALTNPWILSSLALGLGTFVLYAYLLTKVDVTVAAPTITAVFYLVVFLVAALWLRESVTVGRAAGAALLLVAMWLLARDIG